jgi:hypothetical protein
MPESQLDEDATSVRAPAKRKTTYPRDHPTENPKPPKRTKAEIQQAAKAKKEAEQVKKAAAVAEKKKQHIDAEEKRKRSAQRIAAIEDAVQRSQKQLQSHSERPDLKTMETYKEEIQRQKKKQIDSELELIANEEPEDSDIDDLPGGGEDIYMDPPNFPPESAVDTDSDGARLGQVSDDEDDEMDKPYNNEDNESDDDSEGASDDSEMSKDLKKPREKKKKVRMGLFKLRYKAYLLNHPGEGVTEGRDSRTPSSCSHSLCPSRSTAAR